ncbi:MAG: hypothetical protein ACRDJ5_05010 [Actinomycetota bacterium]
MLLVWGGCDVEMEEECVATSDGFAFDPTSRTWMEMPAAPAAAEGARAIWTGTEAVFLGIGGSAEGEPKFLAGVAYDPDDEMWRTIARAPIPETYGGVRVWTGRELVVWGGGERGDPRAARGAAYDPVSDSWRRIASAPLGLNLSSGVWTGELVLVFGSLLDRRNHAETPTSVGAAYDPGTDTWREMPPSALSPQATSAVWLGDRMVAWDYETTSQEYDPVGDRWSAPIDMPLEFNECYPDSAVVGGFLLAWFCGNAALYDEPSDTWQRIQGGPLDERIWSDAYERYIQVWRFADLVPADDVLVLSAEGITLNRKGIACYGCEGSPDSFWMYRAPAEIKPAPATNEVASRRAARDVVSGFMLARILGSEGQLAWLATPQAVAAFGHSGTGLPYELYEGQNFRVEGVRPASGRPGTFRVLARLYFRHGVFVRETAFVGPGIAIGGERLPLLVIGVRG